MINLTIFTNNNIEKAIEELPSTTEFQKLSEHCILRSLKPVKNGVCKRQGADKTLQFLIENNSAKSILCQIESIFLYIKTKPLLF